MTRPTRTGRVRRTTTRLADGRELFYFDDTEPYTSGTATRELVDSRDLEPVVHATQMRRDPLSGEWVSMASHRMTRTHLPPADLCPLCPAGAGREPGEVPASDYDVVVFENRFPSFAGEPGALSQLDGEPLWQVGPAGGRCEVVCFTAEHTATFADLPVQRVRTVVEAWCDRTAELSARPGVEQVFAFENRGEEIGVTLHHPHGQIYAYPFVTPRTSLLLERAKEHRRRTRGHLLRDVLQAERRSGRRIVLDGELWTAYVPAAARWPVEVHLAPHRDVPDLAALDDAERDELAVVYLDLLKRLDRFFPGVDRLPYIAGWHQAPVHDRRELGRLHLQAFSLLRAPGKLKYLAGSESGMAAWINDTTPETIADRLREVAP
ncbi:MAG: galactose-1-phosphate uridylyltransferase [Actinomycetota bacterium]